MRRDQNGDYVVSDEEMTILRAALFVTKFHVADWVREDLHTLTGHDFEEFEALLVEADAVRGDRGIFQIRRTRNETIEYSEGSSSFEFMLGSSLDVPRAEDWDRVVPAKYVGRREEILQNLRRVRSMANLPFRDVPA